jgi:4-nitrophenyl phosphatase
VTNAPAPDWVASVEAFIIDMDGVLYRGAEAIPEARPFLAALDALEIPFMMATNNSTQTPDEYVTKLAGMGIELRPDQVFTSALATADYLRASYPRGTTANVVGMSALLEAVFGDGYFVEAGTDAEVVISGADWRLVYESLRVACLAIRNGADYVATNADVTFPTPEGLVPGAGSIVAALVASGGKEPVVVGKPRPVMVERSLSQLGTAAAQTVMLGDRLDTDILAGERAGCPTVLVTTGISTEEDIEMTGISPDWTITSLDVLRAALESGRR